MGGSLGPVRANIIMIEFEQTVVKPLIDRKLITFYCRYVDDTLLLIKPDSIDLILNYFQKFDKNIRFTYDLFENNTPHFLDINISPNLSTVKTPSLVNTPTLTASFLGVTKFPGSER